MEFAGMNDWKKELLALRNNLAAMKKSLSHVKVQIAEDQSQLGKHLNEIGTETETQIGYLWDTFRHTMTRSIPAARVEPRPVLEKVGRLRALWNILVGKKAPAPVRPPIPTDYLPVMWRRVYGNVFDKSALAYRKLFDQMVMGGLALLDRQSLLELWQEIPEPPEIWAKVESPGERHLIRLYMTLAVWSRLVPMENHQIARQVADQVRLEVEPFARDVYEVSNAFAGSVPEPFKEEQKALEAIKRELERLEQEQELIRTERENLVVELPRVRERIREENEAMNRHRQEMELAQSAPRGIVQEVLLFGILTRWLQWRSFEKHEDAWKTRLDGERMRFQARESALRSRITRTGASKGHLRRLIGTLTSKAGVARVKQFLNDVLAASAKMLPVKVTPVLRKHFPVDDRNRGKGRKRFEGIRNVFRAQEDKGDGPLEENKKRKDEPLSQRETAWPPVDDSQEGQEPRSPGETQP
jgi:hypothetical protein